MEGRSLGVDILLVDLVGEHEELLLVGELDDVDDVLLGQDLGERQKPVGSGITSLTDLLGKLITTFFYSNIIDFIEEKKEKRINKNKTKDV